MKTIGMRELRDRLSSTMREVEEQGQPIEVTDHGRPVARIVPIVRPTTEEERLATISSIADLSAMISDVWDTNRSALEAVRDVRS